MAKRYCKFDKKGMGFHFNGCPSPDTLCIECASNIPNGEEVESDYPKRVKDAAENYALSLNTPTPEIINAFLAGVNWRSKELQQQITNWMNEPKTIDLDEYFRKYKFGFIEDSNGDVIRKYIEEK